MLHRLFVVSLAIAVVLLDDTNGSTLKSFGFSSPDPPNSRAQSVTYGTITQRVNHFDATDNRTWAMRYVSNGQFFKPRGPMFIFIGFAIREEYLLSGQIFDMASEHNGFMFHTEHRFYGESYPTDDFSTDSFKYLNIDQALADLAYFINFIKQTISGLKNSKVVVVGCYYSASMATWARLKYPHLITAAYSSSAPLQAKQDFYEYNEIVSTQIVLTSPKCADTISSAIAQIEEAIEDTTKVHEVETEFRLCNSFNTAEPYRSYFFQTLAAVWGGLLQNEMPSSNLLIACEELLGYNGTSLQKLGAFMRARSGGCMLNYDDYVQVLKITEPTNFWFRSLQYQMCAEYGHFQTSSSENQIFGKNVFVSLQQQLCQDVFGKMYDANFIENGVRRTNSVYGSIHPDITRVVSVHGKLDPWHALGLLEDLSPEAPAIVVQGSPQCGGLFTNDNVSQELREAKQRVKDLIAKWIQ